MRLPAKGMFYSERLVAISLCRLCSAGIRSNARANRQDAIASAALDGDTERACNNPDCDQPYQHAAHVAALASQVPAQPRLTSTLGVHEIAPEIYRKAVYPVPTQPPASNQPPVASVNTSPPSWNNPIQDWEYAAQPQEVPAPTEEEQLGICGIYREAHEEHPFCINWHPLAASSAPTEEVGKPAQPQEVPAEQRTKVEEAMIEIRRLTRILEANNERAVVDRLAKQIHDEAGKLIGLSAQPQEVPAPRTYDMGSCVRHQFVSYGNPLSGIAEKDAAQEVPAEQRDFRRRFSFSRRAYRILSSSRTENGARKNRMTREITRR